MLIDAAYYYDEISTNPSGGFSDSRVVDPDRIQREQAMRSGLDFYPFTREQILQAGKQADFYVKNKPYNDLVRYLLSHYDFDREEAEFVVEDCIDAVQNGASLGEVLQVMQDSVEIGDEETMSAIMDQLVPLWNSTKMWMLKGYSPDELPAARRNGIDDGTPANVMARPPRKAEVFSFQNKQKVAGTTRVLAEAGRSSRNAVRFEPGKSRSGLPLPSLSFSGGINHSTQSIPR
nr:hypothetical protein [Cohnella sp. CFH 77786]